MKTAREQQIITLAEKVMGWKPHPPRAPEGFDPTFPDARYYRAAEGESYARLIVHNDNVHIHQLEGWDPFESIADAWLLVEKLHLTVSPWGEDWRCVRTNWFQAGEITAVGTTNHREWTKAATACEAICAAALAVVRTELPPPTAAPAELSTATETGSKTQEGD